jgi:hypothetical protein
MGNISFEYVGRIGRVAGDGLNLLAENSCVSLVDAFRVCRRLGVVLYTLCG